MEFTKLNGYSVKDIKARPYKSVAEMKSLNLAVDDIVRTIGYYEANDGGGATYLIRGKLETDVIDNGSIHLLNNGLVAELIIKNYVTPELFGAKGEGITDDTEALQLAINYCIVNKKELFSYGGKTYLISSPLNINNQLEMNFNNSVIKTNNEIEMIKFNYANGEEYQGTMKNVVLDMNNVASYGIYATRLVKKTFTGITIKNISKVGYTILAGHEVMFEKSHFYGSSNTSVGLLLKSGDCHYTDIIMINVHHAIETGTGTDFFTRIHAWISDQNILKDSVFFKTLPGIGKNLMNQCYSDTYQTSFYITEKWCRLFLNEHINYNNQTFLSTEWVNANGNITFLKTDTNESENLNWITISNSIIEGLSKTSDKAVFTNVSDDYNKINIDSASKFSYWNTTTNQIRINKIPVSISSTDFALASGKSNKLYCLQNICNLNIYLKPQSQLASGTFTIGQVDGAYKPIANETMFNVTLIRQGGYSKSSSENIVVWMDNSGKIYLGSPITLETTDTISINVTYMCTKQIN